MTLHLHFTLKISVDIFGSLELTLSSQPSFEIFKKSGSGPDNVLQKEFSRTTAHSSISQIVKDD
jgi:hypothetical protein